MAQFFAYEATFIAVKSPASAHGLLRARSAESFRFLGWGKTSIAIRHMVSGQYPRVETTKAMEMSLTGSEPGVRFPVPAMLQSSRASQAAPEIYMAGSISPSTG